MFKVGDKVVFDPVEFKENYVQADGWPTEGKIYECISNDGEYYIGIDTSGELDHHFLDSDGRSLNRKKGTYPYWSKKLFRLASPGEINYHNFPNKLKSIINED